MLEYIKIIFKLKNKVYVDNKGEFSYKTYNFKRIYGLLLSLSRSSRTFLGYF